MFQRFNYNKTTYVDNVAIFKSAIHAPSKALGTIADPDMNTVYNKYTYK